VTTISPPVTELPNAVSAIRRRGDFGRLDAGRVWWALALRSVLAVGFQVLFALAFSISGDASPWRSAADWWLGSFALAEVVNLGLLNRWARAEGIELRDLYNLDRRGWVGDLKWFSLALVVAAPLGFLPNVMLAQALWGDPEVAADLTFRAVPVLAAWSMVVVFPIIHALTELPTYFGYVMPRLQALTGRARMPLLVTSAVLSAQHIFLPFLFDWRYLVWRLLMFLPFALWIGWIINKRPTALPYLVVAHALLDLSLPIYVLQASMGG
jgi:hypothetical protein